MSSPSTSEEIIDCHFHVWDRPFPQRPFPWTPDPFPIGDLLPILDRNGVGRGVDVTPIMNGYDNTCGLEVARATDGRIAVFGRFDAFAPDPRERLERWLANDGAVGVRLTFYGEDLKRLAEPEALDPFWAAAAELGVRVAVFAPDALWEIVRAVERHPTLRLIVDHLGLGVYPGCEDPYAGYPALQEFVPFEQVLVKVSGVVEISREPYPFKDMHEVLAGSCEDFGAERLMWGSNYPVVTDSCTYEESLRFIAEAPFLDAEQKARILAGTCAEMLDEVRSAAA